MIKLLQLVTGNVIVSDIEETDTHYFFKWPAEVRKAVIEQAGETTSKTLIEPFTPHVKGHCVFINKNKVLYIADPVPSLQEYYEKNYLVSESTSTPILQENNNED